MPGNRIPCDKWTTITSWCKTWNIQYRRVEWNESTLDGMYNVKEESRNETIAWGTHPWRLPTWKYQYTHHTYTMHSKFSIRTNMNMYICVPFQWALYFHVPHIISGGWWTIPESSPLPLVSDTILGGGVFSHHADSIFCTMPCQAKCRIRMLKYNPCTVKPV